MEIINGIPKEYELSLTQTAKGLFYVDRLTIRANDEKDILAKFDSYIKEVKERLNQLNINSGIE